MSKFLYKTAVCSYLSLILSSVTYAATEPTTVSEEDIQKSINYMLKNGMYDSSIEVESYESIKYDSLTDLEKFKEYVKDSNGTHTPSGTTLDTSAPNYISGYDADGELVVYYGSEDAKGNINWTKEGPNGVLDSATGFSLDDGILALYGTPENPIQIKGTVTVPNDVILSGVYEGRGSIFSDRNIHVIGNLSMTDSVDWSETDLTNVRNDLDETDFLSLNARGSIIAGTPSGIEANLADGANEFKISPYESGDYSDIGYTLGVAVDGAGNPILDADGKPITVGEGEWHGDYSAIDGVRAGSLSEGRDGLFVSESTDSRFAYSINGFWLKNYRVKEETGDLQTVNNYDESLKTGYFKLPENDVFGNPIDPTNANGVFIEVTNADNVTYIAKVQGVAIGQLPSEANGNITKLTRIDFVSNVAWLPAQIDSSTTAADLNSGVVPSAIAFNAVFNYPEDTSLSPSERTQQMIENNSHPTSGSGDTEPVERRFYEPSVSTSFLQKYMNKLTSSNLIAFSGTGDSKIYDWQVSRIDATIFTNHLFGGDLIAGAGTKFTLNGALVTNDFLYNHSVNLMLNIDPVLTMLEHGGEGSDAFFSGALVTGEQRATGTAAHVQKRTQEKLSY